MSQNIDAAKAGIARKIKWSKDVYEELQVIANEAYTRFLDETSLQMLEERLRYEFNQREKEKRTNWYRHIIRESAKRKVKQDARAKYLADQKEQARLDEIEEVKREVLRLKEQARIRRLEEEERKRQEEEAERRRLELLAAAAGVFEEDSMTSGTLTESSVLSSKGNFLL